MKRSGRVEMLKRFAGLVVAVWLVLATLSAATAASPAAALPDPGRPGPYATAQRTETTTNPATGSQIEIVIYYPASGASVDPSGAPYATIIFAHGFMASTSSYPRNGQHLASWGYIVAMPDFPDEAVQVRASDAQHILDYLEEANANPASLFFDKIDSTRLGITGHSLGGLTAMMVAARDTRIKAVVALDPVDPPDYMAEGWDYETEAPQITAPLLVVGAPSQYCNSFANYDSMYPLVGSAHKAKIVLASGSHCDFMFTDIAAYYTFCYLLCGGSYDEARVQLPVRYATAWFNYYLRGQTDYYTYLYGVEAQADVQAGRVASVAHTAVRNVTATGQTNGIRLNWDLTPYSVVVGYNIYRSTTSGDYSGPPHMQVGRQATYLDAAVALGTRYYYVIKSRDAAGNEHGASAETSAIAGQSPTPRPTATPTHTATPTREATATHTPLSPTVQAERRVFVPLSYRGAGE